MKSEQFDLVRFELQLGLKFNILLQLTRGVYVGKYPPPPPPGAGISAVVIMRRKYEKGVDIKENNLKETKRKTKDKGKY